MNQSLLRPDSAKKNFAFQLFYNIVILVIPLFVSPYLTRTMGSTSLGIYTYTYSVAYYFVVFALLGINKHGQRIIARRRHDLLLLRKTFWSLYFIHCITSVLALAAYVIYVFFVCKSDRTIALIQTIYVFSAALDITWLFYGLEKFKLEALRNAFVKILETVCIFAFVKSPQDVGTYTLIMSVSICLGQAIMMPQIIAEIPPVRFTKGDVMEHIQPLFTLFAAVIAITLYTIFDKTLLGILATKDDVAFYEYSDKIINIPRTFINIIGTVLFPRACSYASDKEFVKLERNFEYCLIVASFIGFASVFGLAAIAQSFAALYYGEAFAVCGSVIISMAPLILIIGLGDAVRLNFIYPLKKDALMVRILSMSAVTNLLLSAFLIPKIGIYGAVVGTIGAESIGLAAQIWVSRKYLSVGQFLHNTLPFAVNGVLMYISVRLVAARFDGSFPALLVQILTGAIVYCALTLFYACFSKSLTHDLFFDTMRSLRAKASHGTGHE